MPRKVVAGHVRNHLAGKSTPFRDESPGTVDAMRIELAGGFFHVTMRGNARAEIFHDSQDYRAFVRRLETTIPRFGWICHAYCAIPNHFHLLLETPEPNLADGMQVLNGSLARRYNARYDRVGHVFQTPYSSTPVLDDPHFMQCSRYIPLNPVRAGLCSDPADWSWSSYRATAGLDPPPTFLTVAFTRQLFDGVEHFAAFVAAGAMSGKHLAGHGPHGHARSIE